MNNNNLRVKYFNMKYERWTCAMHVGCKAFLFRLFQVKQLISIT